jgi:hypothetical protein
MNPTPDDPFIRTDFPADVKDKCDGACARSAALSPHCDKTAHAGGCAHARIRAGRNDAQMADALDCAR